MATFIELCLQGEVFLDEIDDYVDLWHDGDEGLGQELEEFLGMTHEEYNHWVRFPSDLGLIIHAREDNINFEQALNEKYSFPIAARSNKADQLKIISDWLKLKGK